jgi:hypothetical protein
MPLDDSPIVPLAIFGGAGLALYEFAYKPWAARQAVAAATAAAAKANLAKGMGIEEAAQNAIAGACVAAAVAKLHMTPDQAAPLCKGIGVLTEKGLKYAGKGAIIAGKEVGKAAVVVGKEVEKGAVAVGRGTVTAAKGTGQIVAAAASVPLAPIKQVVNVVRHPVTGVKNAVVTAVYRNPVAVGKTVVNAVTHPVSTVKSIVTAPLHPVDTAKKVASVAKKVLCFGFCDLGDVDALDVAEGDGRRARRTVGALAKAPGGNPFAAHARNRDRPANRKPRSLAGLPAGGRRPRNSAAAGADFYLRHL